MPSNRISPESSGKFASSRSFGAPVFLVGYRCTGKTTIGKLLAQALGLSFLDTDQVIEAQVKMTIADMVADQGWEAFRSLETRVLAALSKETGAVVSTGGGIVLAPANRDILASTGTCIWLKADQQTIVDRLLADSLSRTQRPNLTDTGLEAETQNMLATRTPLYEKVADIVLDTATCRPDHCVEQLLRRLDQ